MVSRVIISIFCPSLRKLKWKFPLRAKQWWTNQASMAMRKSSCKNTPQYLRSCCSLIGQNNTKDFSAQSGGSIGRAVWKWSGKSRFPGALSALLVNQRRFISLPDLFPLASANRPWVSEDGLFLSDYLLFQGVVNVIPHTWKLPLSKWRLWKPYWQSWKSGKHS